MNRSSYLYRFLKKCEKPPAGSVFWLGMNFLFNTSMILLGRILFQLRIRKKCLKGDTFVITSSFSMGDILFLERSWSTMEKVNGLTKPILILERYLSLPATAVGLKNLMPMSAWQILVLSKALLFSPWRYPGIIMYPWIALAIYDYDIIFKNMPQKLPCAVSRETLRCIFGNSDMRGKSVILAPYEQSYYSVGEARLPKSFWSELSCRLKKRGFYVFTNCDGKVELPIEGTAVFFPAMDELAGAVEYAGNCISVRSGFTDWSSGARSAKHVVLYPSKRYYNRYSMNSVWGREDFMELIYDLQSDSLEVLAEQILHFFDGK